MAWKFHLSDALEAGKNAIVSAANAARSVASNVLLTQHVGPDGEPQPSGADSDNPVYGYNTNEAQFDYTLETSIRDTLRDHGDLLKLVVAELRRLNMYQSEMSDIFVSIDDANAN
jgi:hypothetical protein